MEPYTSINCLVVDDMKIARKKIIQTLNSIGIEKVVEAKDGVEALELFEEAIKSGQPFQLILSDLNMPNMNGVELVKKVKSNPEGKTTPFLMLTAESEKTVIMEAIKAGVDNYISKPFTPDELKDKITKVLRV
jgi:two-component system, chemotaxis family, chemotaxis protein CheY